MKAEESEDESRIEAYKNTETTDAPEKIALPPRRLRKRPLGESTAATKRRRKSSPLGESTAATKRRRKSTRRADLQKTSSVTQIEPQTFNFPRRVDTSAPTQEGSPNGVIECSSGLAPSSIFPTVTEEEVDPIVMGYPALGENIARKDAIALEAEYLELMRAETVLLRFAKTLRTLLHSLKANSTRLKVWQMLKKHRETHNQQRIRPFDQLRQAFRLIKPHLPSSYGPQILSPHRSMRAKTVTSTRLWSSEEDELLVEVMVQTLVKNLVSRQLETMSPVAMDKREAKEALRRGLMDEKGERSDAEFVIDLMKRTDQALMSTRATQASSIEWWRSFWDTVSSQLASNKSGREVQIRWVHWIDPRINRSPEWSKSEEAKLIQLVQNDLQKDSKKVDWRSIAENLGTGRTTFSVFQRFQTALNTELTSKEWTPEQDQLLLDSVSTYNGNKRHMWSRMSEIIGQKTNDQCRSRYDLLTREAKKGNWTMTEDLQLQILVALHGRGSWARIASFLPLRTEVQCRERYENMLAPELEKKRPWTEEENERLRALVKELTPGKWARYSEYFEGRTDAEIARQWSRLDPLGAVEHGASQAVKQIFIPTKFNLRKAVPALEESDFSCEIADQFSVLMKRVLSYIEAHPPSRARRPRGRRNLAFCLDIDSSLFQYLPMASNDVRNASIAHRLLLFRRFLDSMSTGNKDADSHIHAMIKALMRKKEIAYELPGNSYKCTALTDAECEVIDQLGEKGISMKDFVQYDDIHEQEVCVLVKQGELIELFPEHPDLQNLVAQKVLRELLIEFSQGYPEEISVNALKTESTQNQISPSEP